LSEFASVLKSLVSASASSIKDQAEEERHSNGNRKPVARFADTI